MFTAGLVVLAVIIVPAMVIFGLGGPSPAPLETKIAKGEDIPIRVYLHESDQIVTMSLEEYIKGVVAAEMPAEFHSEALKAQAVAARTYAVKNMTLFGGPGLTSHPGADVSTDHRESQAWLSPLQLKARWGPFKYNHYWDKISQAVEQTRGQIVTYNGEPINAVFHSTSADRTASALEVWGIDYPYLKSVPCSWDKQSPRYTDTKTLTFAELEQRLGSEAGVLAAVRSDSGTVAQIIDRTESGRVNKVRIGSKTFTGNDLREKLELRSANFTIEAKEDGLVFNTVGYGHGVGLCQYGANGMAKAGRNYREILSYYYTGTAIKDIYGS